MKNTTFATLIQCFIFISVFVVGITIGLAIGEHIANKNAIRAGVAEYRVNPTNGVVTFEFKNK